MNKILTLAVLSALSLSSVASNYKSGDIVVRGGLTLIDPNNDNTGVYADALGGDTPLSVSVDDNTQLGLNVTYFYDRNWAVELLAASPFTHDVTINDPQGISEGIFGANVDGISLGEATHLPPTVSVLYYFDTIVFNIKPYVGLGVNYTIFFDEKFNSAPKSLGFNNLELDSSFGFSAQVGMDYQLTNNWHINASVRYIDIDTTANFNIGDTIEGSANIEIDPMVYSVMLGYKF